MALLTPERALETVLCATPVQSSMRVTTDQAIGRVLAEDVVADQDYPPFDRAMMDGYAVRLADAGSRVPVVGEVAAGSDWDGVLANGHAVSIMTGAPCPTGTEAVVQKEHVEVVDDQVQLPAEIAADRNIVRGGSESAKGQTAVSSGAVVTPLHRALMATFGYSMVSIVPPPTAFVIATGTELATETDTPAKSQIRSSNAPMLQSFLDSSGADCIGSTVAADEDDLLIEAFRSASNAKIILSTGGISAGNYDRVPNALEAIGAEIIFRGVEQRPGKPMLFARAEERGQLIFGLSGNPMACLVGYNVYVLPALRKLMGFEQPNVTRLGELGEPIQGRGNFTWFATGIAQPHENGWRVTPLIGRGAADMFTTANANALIHVPPGATLAPGDPVTFQLFPGSSFAM